MTCDRGPRWFTRWELAASAAQVQPHYAINLQDQILSPALRHLLDDLTHGDGSMYSSYDEDIRVLANLDRMMSVGLSLKSDW